MVLALVLAMALSVLVGSRMVPLAAIFDGSHPDRAVIDARLVRTALGLLIGAAFGLAGACMQGLTRNPLADPGLLGVNAGAAFAIVVAITVFGISTLQGYIWFGFLGAALAAFVVHTIASFGRDGATPAKLTMAGAACAAGLTSWTVGILLLNREALEVMRRWQVGTIGGRTWDTVWSALPFVAAGALLALCVGSILNTLALGDDLARGLGRKTARDRVVVGLAVVLLAGVGTAVAGPIAFVGLIVPHFVRRFTGSDYRFVLPLSAAWGAVLMLLADTAGRIVLPPSEVQVGVMTSLVGVPFFVWLLRNGRMAGL